MRKLQLSLILASLCLLVVACSDDDPVKPDKFSVVIKVTDPVGVPVEGLRVGLVNDHQFFQDGFGAAKAAVSIPFRALMAAHLRVTVEDIEGGHVQLITETDALPGSYSFVWDGRDDEGVHQPSGRYTAHVVVTDLDTGLWLFEERTDMLLSMLDSSRVPAGYTTSKGKLTLWDQKLFPHLYDRPDMTATDETAEILGVIDLTPMMRISLTDTVTGRYTWFKMEVPGETELELVWNPPPPVAQPSLSPGEPILPAPALIDTTKAEMFEMGRIHPNPFN